MDDKILEGTTTVGITCKDGVVFASAKEELVWETL